MEPNQRPAKISRTLRSAPASSSMSVLDAHLSTYTELEIASIQRKLEKGIPFTLAAEGEELVMIVGRTGAGKTVIRHYLMRKTIKLTDGRIDVEGEDPTTMSSTVEPGTLYAQTVKDPELPFAWTDTPGLGSGGTRRRRVVESVSIELTARKASGIRGFILVIPYEDINSTRYKEVMELIRTVSILFRNIEEVLDSSIVVISKLPWSNRIPALPEPNEVRNIRAKVLDCLQTILEHSIIQQIRLQPGNLRLLESKLWEFQRPFQNQILIKRIVTSQGVICLEYKSLNDEQRVMTGQLSDVDLDLELGSIARYSKDRNYKSLKAQIFNVVLQRGHICANALMENGEKSATGLTADDYAKMETFVQRLIVIADDFIYLNPRDEGTSRMELIEASYRLGQTRIGTLQKYFNITKSLLNKGLVFMTIQLRNLIDVNDATTCLSDTSPLISTTESSRKNFSYADLNFSEYDSHRNDFNQMIYQWVLHAHMQIDELEKKRKEYIFLIEEIARVTTQIEQEKEGLRLLQEDVDLSNTELQVRASIELWSAEQATYCSIVAHITDEITKQLLEVGKLKNELQRIDTDVPLLFLKPIRNGSVPIYKPWDKVTFAFQVEAIDQRLGQPIEIIQINRNSLNGDDWSLIKDERKVGRYSAVYRSHYWTRLAQAWLECYIRTRDEPGNKQRIEIINHELQALYEELNRYDVQIDAFAQDNIRLAELISQAENGLLCLQIFRAQQIKEHEVKLKQYGDKISELNAQLQDKLREGQMLYQHFDINNGRFDLIAALGEYLPFTSSIVIQFINKYETFNAAIKAGDYSFMREDEDENIGVATSGQLSTSNTFAAGIETPLDGYERIKQQSISKVYSQGTVGPRNIENWTLEDVEDDGNCFYYAVIRQLVLLNQPFLAQLSRELDVQKPHSALRNLVAKERGTEAKDKVWATDNDMQALAKIIPDIIIAVVDTRRPHMGFRAYYFDSLRNDVIVHANMDDTLQIPIGRPIIRLAATGNHYLSILQHPSLSQGVIREAFDSQLMARQTCLSTTPAALFGDTNHAANGLTDDIQSSDELIITVVDDESPGGESLDIRGGTSSMM